MKKISLLQALIDLYGFDAHTSTGLIMSGKVLVNDRPATKVGTPISQEIIDKPNGIRIKDYDKYVSRGAHKLLGALTDFNVDVNGLTCLDIGSSTGGFTDVLLQNGAKAVFDVDCGSNQLDYKIRSDSRVTVYEQHSIQNMLADDFPDKIDLAVMDVSFTSAVGIIQHIFENKISPAMIVLIKPQFEYARLKNILNLSGDFDGIVKDQDESLKILEYVKTEILAIPGVKILNCNESHIRGTKGNIEYLVYCRVSTEKSYFN